MIDEDDVGRIHVEIGEHSVALMDSIDTESLELLADAGLAVQRAAELLRAKGAPPSQMISIFMGMAISAAAPDLE